MKDTNEPRTKVSEDGARDERGESQGTGACSNSGLVAQCRQTVPSPRRYQPTSLRGCPHVKNLKFSGDGRKAMQTPRKAALSRGPA